MTSSDPITTDNSPMAAPSGRPLLAAKSPPPVLLPLLALLVLTLVTQLAGALYPRSWGATDPSLLSVVLLSVALLSAITIPTAGLGLWLGGRIGLGAPLLTDLLQRRVGAVSRLRRDAMLAIPLGLGVGVILLLVRMVSAPYLPPELPAFGHRGVVAGLLVSVGAAIGEETWLRLGVMTILAWPLARPLGHPQIRPVVAWAANILAALAFGLIHLPQLAQSGAATPGAIAGTLLGNGIVGITCGWLYWRRSLVAAIIAHFAVDFVLHVLTATRI